MAFDYPGEKLKNYKSNLETQTHVLVSRVETNYTNHYLTNLNLLKIENKYFVINNESFYLIAGKTANILIIFNEAISKYSYS